MDIADNCTVIVKSTAHNINCTHTHTHTHTHTTRTATGQNNRVTGNSCYARNRVFFILGIGAAVMGSLVTIATILAGVGVVRCYRKFKKREQRYGYN